MRLPNGINSSRRNFLIKRASLASTAHRRLRIVTGAGEQAQFAEHRRTHFPRLINQLNGASARRFQVREPDLAQGLETRPSGCTRKGHCVFQTNLDTDSTRSWTVIPRQAGHRFQSKLDSQS